VPIATVLVIELTKASVMSVKDTPDGTAFALNANVEAFVLPNLSVRCCSSASLGIPRGD